MEVGKKKPDADAIRNVIQLLEHVHLRPGMYVGDTAGSMIHFLTGFRVALVAAFDLESLHKHRSSVVKDRGYQTTSHWYHGIFDQVRDRFPAEMDATAEFVSIELDAWKRLLEST